MKKSDVIDRLKTIIKDAIEYELEDNDDTLRYDYLFSDIEKFLKELKN